MSDQAIDAAVEKILGDQDYARLVYESPEEALKAEFDLAPGEWRSIAWCLREDVEGSLILMKELGLLTPAVQAQRTPQQAGDSPPALRPI